MNKRILFVFVMLAALVGCAVNGGNSGNSDAFSSSLEDWIKEDLGPYLRQQLVDRPVFSGEPVMVVAMEGMEASAVTNDLTAYIEQGILEELNGIPDIKLVRAPESDDQCNYTGRKGVSYYIGVNVTRAIDERLAVTVKAFDLREEMWVPDFTRVWRGRVDSEQSEAFERAVTDNYFIGSREVPFTLEQQDQAARFLAKTLECKLRWQNTDDIVIYMDTPARSPLYLGALYEMAQNHLAASGIARVSNDRSSANMILGGRSIKAGDDLYQIWLTLEHKDTGVRLKGVDAVSYIKKKPGFTEVAGTQTGSSQYTRQGVGNPPKINHFRVVEPILRTDCGSADPWKSGTRPNKGSSVITSGNGCFALEIEYRDGKDVYIYRQAANGMLYRLLPSGCGVSADIVRRPEKFDSLRFPARTSTPSIIRTDTMPGVSTYYAIVAANEKTSGEIDTHIRKLPASDCGFGSSGTVNGDSDSRNEWVGQLRNIIEDNEETIRWKYVKVRQEL